MRSVSEHLAAVLAGVRPVPPLDVVLADADGCILAEDVTAGDDVPAWSVAACDGYAVRVADVGRRNRGPGERRSPAVGPSPDVTLPVLHDAPVTSSAPLRLVDGTAILVAAGAPVPLGADAVVPVGSTDRGRARVVVRGGADAGQYIHPPGFDVPAAEPVLQHGTRLAARHLAVAAAVGRGRLTVHPSPRVVVVSIGDELVLPGRSRSTGQVFDADAPALVAAVRETGAHAVRVGPVGDDRSALREVLADQIVRADLLVLTGGLGGGPGDTVADVLAPLGTVRFDQVAMSPGQRQGYGMLERDDDAIPVFALPGRPFAALVAFETFVRPALRAMAGHEQLFRPSLRAAATRGWESPAGLREFVPATLTGSPAQGYRVEPVGDPGRQALWCLAGANALAVVDEATTTVHAGDALACLVLEG